MVRKEAQNQPVTQTQFLEETKSIRSEIRTLDDKVNKLDDAVHKIASGLLTTQGSLRQVQETMLTKEDGQKIIEHIDAWSRRFETYDGKALVQDHRLNDHETRIARLETAGPK